MESNFRSFDITTGSSQNQSILMFFKSGALERLCRSSTDSNNRNGK